MRTAILCLLLSLCLLGASGTVVAQWTYRAEISPREFKGTEGEVLTGSLSINSSRELRYVQLFVFLVPVDNPNISSPLCEKCIIFPTGVTDPAHAPFRQVRANVTEVLEFAMWLPSGLTGTFRLGMSLTGQVHLAGDAWRQLELGEFEVAAGSLLVIEAKETPEKETAFPAVSVAVLASGIGALLWRGSRRRP